MLVCGGLTGVMEAASRGAAEAGGTVLGVLPTLSPADANPYVTHAVATGTATPGTSRWSPPGRR